ncbi:membrane protein DedA with SNARE-associated domain [Clostridium saccharoperbutylacetonicum]|uniref:VTT domain-containing protein n=1 Tax=Clostridium saccharoperbutylacetonicum N1-4(HMT) TaxID=931276 RepID=M1MXY0_9CLOT|nr:DedA family protein [Clostridium saccharoperbutylacetonicum]AGF56252.1 hypothetical protein Cspa_c24870 [Clostridium saccharoperbutylacetonicum N1-4(HMT)]NRT63005.1 membrane protein DedA with SNARE-associated domain [Clostridium saccharoperbutylacetonicum]NSB26362.1 membrane protein DedA with SNARE-associated domain [Clostridium saccharoperbutylacetonicum]NSB45715.1 membrane protein DedA with SNARE-associated domain [Clostridium saccharoperbutylacetonicum]
MVNVLELFNHYGYIVLLIALFLELLALPLPGETLMTYCGYVVSEGKMNLGLSIVIATIGICSGITLSYYIGRALEITFFEKYGRYFHLDKSKIEKTSKWFDKYGNKILIVAYFIPGIRHVTGYFSGIINMPYKKFAGYAYIGAVIWTTVFMLLGDYLGVNWEKYHYLFKRYFIIIGISIVILIILIYMINCYRLKKTKENSEK